MKMKSYESEEILENVFFSLSIFNEMKIIEKIN